MDSNTLDGQDRVDFPISGEHFRFLSDPGDSDHLVFDFVVDPGGGVPLRHQHADQEEVYRCRSGRLHLMIGEAEQVLEPGAEATVPRGAVHSLENRGEDPVVCEVEYRPAGRNREWFKLQGAFMAETGREPGTLDLAPFLGDVGIFIEGPPVTAQKLLFALVLKPVAIALGRRRRMLRFARARYGEEFTW
ncbi:MAG: cupin domain-containing protein [Microthrixaceae bacterium]